MLTRNLLVDLQVEYRSTNKLWGAKFLGVRVFKTPKNGNGNPKFGYF